MIKVLIADDHLVVRQGVRKILEETSDIVLAGEASTGKELLAKIRAEGWDVVLLDISMPDMNGLLALNELKQEKPDLPILIFTIHSEEQFAIRALKAGAAGYMNKEIPSDDLVKAIRKVAVGGRYVSDDLAEKMAFDLQKEHPERPHETLSNREFQIMRMIASGKSLKEIGDELFLSAKTISTYRARILEKMNMKNNAELTLYASHNMLLDS